MGSEIQRWKGKSPEHSIANSSQRKRMKDGPLGKRNGTDRCSEGNDCMEIELREVVSFFWRALSARPAYFARDTVVDVQVWFPTGNPLLELSSLLSVLFSCVVHPHLPTSRLPRHK